MAGNARELRNAIDTYRAIGVLPTGRTAPESSALDLALAQLVTLDKPYADQKEEISERFTRVYLRAGRAEQAATRRPPRRSRDSTGPISDACSPNIESRSPLGGLGTGIVRAARAWRWATM